MLEDYRIGRWGLREDGKVARELVTMVLMEASTASTVAATAAAAAAPVALGTPVQLGSRGTVAALLLLSGVQHVAGEPRKEASGGIVTWKARVYLHEGLERKAVGV